MTTRTVWVYSEQELTPRAFDVLQTIKQQCGYEDVKFKEYHGLNKTDKVLVFGPRGPENYLKGTEFIHTFSIAQLMSKPNAMTVVDASLKLYFGHKHVPPILGPTVPFDTVLGPLECGFHPDLPVVIDIETSGNLGVTDTPETVEIISIAMYQPSRYNYDDGMSPPVVWAVAREDEPGTVGLPQNVLDMFASQLPKFEKAIYHNGKFDTRVLNRVLGVKLCVWFDTMLAHHVLNHAAAMHGLKELCQRYLGAPDWEGDIKKYTKGGGHYERIPWKNLVEYNGWDVYWTYQLYLLLAPQIEINDDNQVAFLFEMQVADFLLDVEANGIPFNHEAALELADIQTAIMDERKRHLANITGNGEFNPGSPQQVKKAIYENTGIMVGSTNEETIEELVKNWGGNPWVQDFGKSLIEYRKASKIKGTYALGWFKQARNGRVHPTFLVHGTSTGRLSSTKPNAQNMPREKKIRKIVSV